VQLAEPLSNVNTVHMRTRPHTRPSTRRDEIISAAREIVVREGLEALRMRDVAASAGITAPAIYRHFADKDELVAGVIEGANELLGSYVQRCLAGTDPRDRLNLVLTALRDFGLNERYDYQLLFFVRAAMHPDRQPLTRRSPNFIFLLDRIRECIDAGVLRSDLDPAVTGVSLWAQVHGLVSLHMQGRFGDDDEKFREMFSTSIGFLIDGLTPAASTR
jgi:AcrR family transcriptional regulator